MSNQVTLNLRAGTHIDEAAKLMVEEANRTFSVVKASFNGFTLSAAPFSNPTDIAKQYSANCQRTSLEYKSSPEGIAKANAQKIKREAMLNAAPKEFPIEVLLSVTTGRLLTKPGAGGAENGIYAMYEFIEHCLATDGCFDLAAPRMAKTLAPLLIERFPELEIPDQKLQELAGLLNLPMSSSYVIETWIATLDLPQTYLVPVMVQKKHEP